MKFAGLIKSSFVDYPKNICAVVFTFGCNLNCWFCHNRQIIEGEEIENFDESEILDFLKTRVGILDAVVVSGGEPTLCQGLEDFIRRVKAMGFKVKLDTNGTNPGVLENLLKQNLLDYVAMDVKTSLEKYEKLTQCKVDVEKIKQSIEILMSSKIDYEFRTTFAPDVLKEDIEKIAKLICGAKNFAIQKYNPQSNCSLKIPHSTQDFQQALEVAKSYVSNTFLRSMP